jgi:hypothetical protein
MEAEDNIVMRHRIPAAQKPRLPWAGLGFRRIPISGYPAGMRTLARREDLTICFAHVAYRMAERFAARGTNIKHFQVGALEELA